MRSAPDIGADFAAGARAVGGLSVIGLLASRAMIVPILAQTDGACLLSQVRALSVYARRIVPVVANNLADLPLDPLTHLRVIAIALTTISAETSAEALTLNCSGMYYDRSGRPSPVDIAGECFC
jgi:hypothetical protein